MRSAKSHSLKKRAYFFLILSSLIPLSLIGYISYISLYSLHNENIDDGIRSNVLQLQISMNNVFNNLEDAALQLAMYNGKVADDIETFINTDDYMTQYEMKKAVIDNISPINAAKPDLGLIFFYYADKNEVLFENQSVKDGFSPKMLPVLGSGINASYFGPHVTGRAAGAEMVFSIARKVNLIAGADMYVYMETSLKLFQDLLQSQQYKLSVSSILLNQEGKVMYSQLPDVFPLGQSVAVGELNEAGKSKTIKPGYYVYSRQGEQGWYILAAVNRREYSADVYQWMNKFVLLSLLSILISLLLGFSIWRIVYKPLRTINKEILLVSRTKFNTKAKTTGIIEFDGVLEQFYIMRNRLSELFKELEEKERKKRMVEVEKLMHQINPHFLHNTLNTVQWLARMNGQDEIDRLVALFTRVLHYNLGKEGGIVQLGEEIAVLQDYVDLQRIRYAYHFDVQLQVDPELSDVQVPRFIMQPIVENAIYHGLKDESGRIEIEVFQDGGLLVIVVKDNGEGMSEEDIGRLLAEQTDTHKKVGMGIGLSYVKHMLDVYYGEAASMNIIGRQGSGTTFELRLPLKRAAHKEESYDSCVNRG
ncbi:sensor histidine kinase [Paenibacillus glycanilyticus]|uniref:sensor histidine kinase n=1 Tax=Paenibacillus glycanilyticus TaxID=126569 RepID=UPI000FDCC62D|nr:histidine kinase [Paenibacillus glycanilyticus]